jgi:hypothetical protein
LPKVKGEQKRLYFEDKEMEIMICIRN